MTIDWSKPVQTRDGRPVRILSADVKSDYPIITAIETDPGKEIVMSFLPDGRHLFSDKLPYLINVPEERELWLNVYDRGTGIFPTRESANVINQGRINAGYAPRIACVHVKYKVGEGLE